MTEANLIERLAGALAQKEGWYNARLVPSVAQRLNNPLCLTHWKAADGTPLPEICGYVKFPDVESGWRAGRAQCRINVLKRKLTWRSFFAGQPGIYKGFCPARGDAKQDPIQYARAIMALMHVEADLDTPIIDLIAEVMPRAA